MNQVFMRLKLAPRLALAFGLVMLVSCIASGVGIWRLDRLQRVADDLGGDSSQRALLAQELHAIVVISAERAETLLQIDNADFATRINADRKTTSSRSEVVRKRLEELADTEETKQHFVKIDEAGNKFRLVRDALVKARAASGSADTRQIVTALRPAADAYSQAVRGLADYQARRVEEARTAADASRREGVTMLVGGMVVALGLSGLCAWLLSRSITRPLAEATQRAEYIAAGDLSLPVHSFHGGDEVQHLLGDLGTMQTKLSQLVSSVQQVSQSVNAASSEIAAGNMDLSGRTEQTASNLQRAATSMVELTATVKQSADSAGHASRLATSASSIAVRGGAVVGNFVATMNEISGSSQKIADIIGVIDGIAFQTNILALNAAVEAARAGEQGRGFAVVASEVRGLAGRSAQAAKEIKELIGTSVANVRSGSALVAEAGTTMNEIVASVQQVAQIIGAVSAAAGAQSEGISRVNQTVNEIDQMTQQNSALVEQSAAATASLKEQAELLAMTVGSFRLA